MGLGFQVFLSQLVHEIGRYSVVGVLLPLFLSMCLPVRCLIHDNTGKNMAREFFSVLQLSPSYAIDFCGGGGGRGENNNSHLTFIFCDSHSITPPLFK